jgi:hypothetical protein
MGRRKWRKAPADRRAAQLTALRAEIGEVAAENIVNFHPVPIERPAWRPTETPDESVADALVALVPPPPETNGGAAGEAATEAPAAPAAPAAAAAPALPVANPAAVPAVAPTTEPPPGEPEAPRSESSAGPADTLDPHG